MKMSIIVCSVHLIVGILMLGPVQGAESDCSKDTRQASNLNLQTCLTMVKQAVVSTPISPVVTVTSGALTVYPELTFTAGDITYDNLCCMKKTLRGGTVTLDPLSSSRNPANLFKNKPSITFDVTDSSLKGSSNYYTIGIFDSTDGDSPNLSFQKPFMHWLNINVRGLDMTTGTEVYDYGPTTSSNNYGLLVLKQTGVIFNFDESKYFTGCRNCNFDISQMVSDHSLQPVGVSIIRPQPNLYTVEIFQGYNITEAEACTDWIPGFDKDCLSGGPGTRPGVAAVIALAVLTTFKLL